MLNQQGEFPFIGSYILYFTLLYFQFRIFRPMQESTKLTNKNCQNMLEWTSFDWILVYSPGKMKKNSLNKLTSTFASNYFYQTADKTYGLR